ncbi:MAG: S-adenosyl-l-methionine hydroxide adenosyltransferase family protein [Actinomycetota bacterium]
MARPIVFLTDYGLADEFVGVCHAVMRSIAPDAPIVDLTHAIRRHDVLQGSIVLGRAARYAPPDAVYVAVVDPGVGSERRAIAVEAASGAVLVGPDNGLLSGAWRALGGATRAVEITAEEVAIQPVSKTFHGRDIFTPAAAHVARGFPLERLGASLDPTDLRVVDLPRPMVAAGSVGGRAVMIDGFGNVQLNVRPDDLERAGLGAVVEVGSRRVPRVATFADLPSGKLGLIVDSQGFVALVVNNGSAAELLGLRPGVVVVLS